MNPLFLFSWLILIVSTMTHSWGGGDWADPPVPLFPNFSAVWKQLAMEYHVYICEVSPHLSCVGTCQIWMWFKESNRYFCKIEIFAYGEINEWSFSNPTPWTVWLMAAKHIIWYHPACCIVLHSVSLASISRTRLTGLAHNNEPSYAGLLDVQPVLISQAGVTRLA